MAKVANTSLWPARQSRTASTAMTTLPTGHRRPAARNTPRANRNGLGDFRELVAHSDPFEQNRDDSNSVFCSKLFRSACRDTLARSRGLSPPDQRSDVNTPRHRAMIGASWGIGSTAMWTITVFV